MKYAHISPDNIICGWYDTEINNDIPLPNVQVSDDQWQGALNSGHNHITNEGITSFVDTKTLAEHEDEIRGLRWTYLKDDVDPIVSNPLRWVELTPEKQAEWATYRTALLNVPQQAGFPHTVAWPTKPE
tara:strand:- start:109 stop:495 length:387 start_codon:yes stop_codon:yes gene_type:complete